MTYLELKKMLDDNINIVVRFTEEIEDFEGPDEGMIAALLNIEDSPYEDDTLHLFFDFSGYEEENKAVAKHDFYDNNGEPTLSWFETNFYPSDGKWDIYVFKTNDVPIFELMPSCPYCEGDMAVYWEDDDNYAFIDSEGNLLVAAAGHQMSFGVPRCPMCGKRFKTGG